MLNGYIEALKQLTSSFSGKEVSFTDCIYAMELGFLLLFIILFILAAMLGIYFVPMKVSRIVIKSDIEALKTNLKDGVYNLPGAVKKKHIIVAFISEIIYLPISIPICLYIIGLLAR